VKSILHERYGFSPLTSTRFSVLLEMGILPFAFLSLIFVSPFVLFLNAILAADVFFRISIVFDDSYPAFGFGEWLAAPGLAGVVRKGWSTIRARIRGSRESDD
jgi:hypothetical protein